MHRYGWTLAERGIVVIDSATGARLLCRSRFAASREEVEAAEAAFAAADLDADVRGERQGPSVMQVGDGLWALRLRDDGVPRVSLWRQRMR